MNEQAWRYVGPITMLQVQLYPLKVGDVVQFYQPAGALRPVHHFAMDVYGITADIGGEQVYDAHHRHHPQSRNRISNGVSFGFTSHYQQMQTRFGDHMHLGIAGENIIVDASDSFDELTIERGVAIESTSGEVIIFDAIFAIPPCKPFAKYCLQLDEIDSKPQLMKDTLQFLLGGVRGFCVEPRQGERFTVTVGDRFWIRR